MHAGFWGRPRRRLGTGVAGPAERKPPGTTPETHNTHPHKQKKAALEYPGLPTPSPQMAPFGVTAYRRLNLLYLIETSDPRPNAIFLGIFDGFEGLRHISSPQLSPFP